MIRPVCGKAPRIASSAFVSEAAYIVGDVEIGANSSIWPGAVLRSDFASIRVGSNSEVEDNSVLHAGDEPLTIGDNVLIGHGVVVHCRSIADNVLIGSNATLLDEAEIGHHCVIAAGAVVTPGMKVPDYSFVAGVPGQVRGKASASQLEQISRGPVMYGKLIAQYKAEGLHRVP